METTQLASSGEPLSLDGRFAAIAGLSRDRDVPLISLKLLGIHHDEDELWSSISLTALPSGAEAIPYFDKEWVVDYKLVDLRVGGGHVRETRGLELSGCSPDRNRRSI